MFKLTSFNLNGIRSATPAVAEKARTEHIYKSEKFSDHAPITIGYDFSI